jgi:2-keto-4-pentenoate hydratase/2-oxohepta-3-ene-1,7-dioic acid hydratase in catechol pathway
VRIARFAHAGEISYGFVQGDPTCPATSSWRRCRGTRCSTPTPTGEVLPLSAVRLLAPTQPINVVCIGKNYADHVAEMADVTGAPAPSGDPTVFLKPATSVIGPGDPIRLPAGVGAWTTRASWPWSWASRRAT